MSDAYVWIAEAFENGERTERVVHKNESDARHDIQTLAYDADEIRVEKERLHLGEDTEWSIER